MITLKTNFRTYVLLGLALAFFFASCGEYKEVTITKIGQARIAKMDASGVEAEIDVKINNPNKIGFKIFKSDVDVSLNGSPMGKAHLKKKIKIKANTEDTYTFIVVGKFDNLLSGGGLGGIISMATSKSANITLKGTISAGKFLYRKKFPIDRTQKVPLSKPQL